MKKFISGLLAFTMLMGGTAVTQETGIDFSNTIKASADTDAWGREYYEYGDLNCLDKADGTVSIIGFNINKTTAVIPETINGRTVTEIGNYAFYDATKLTSIEIPNTVTIIGENAFYKCQSLESIDIPDNVTRINRYAFYDTGLKTIKIPSKLTTISYFAFAYSELERVELPNNIKNIDEKAFFSCKNLKYFKFPDEVDDLKRDILAYSSNLEEIVLPKNITEIPEDLAWYCTSLKKVTFPETVTKIGRYAFCHCTSLEDITLPKGIKELDEAAFRECPGIKTMELPEGLETIGKYCFRDSYNLESLTIPKSVTSIGHRSLDGCDNLTLRVPEGSVVEDFLKTPYNDCKSIIVCGDNSKYLKYQYSKSGNDSYSVRFLLVVDEEVARNADLVSYYFSSTWGETTEDFYVDTAYKNVKADGKIVSAGEGKVFIPCLITNIPNYPVNNSDITAHVQIDFDKYERTAVYQGKL